VSQDFWPPVCIIKVSFEYGVEFVEKFDSEIAFRGLNDNADADFFAGVNL
jgi:hypothetical protein